MITIISHCFNFFWCKQNDLLCESDFPLTAWSLSPFPLCFFFQPTIVSFAWCFVRFWFTLLTTWHPCLLLYHASFAIFPKSFRHFACNSPQPTAEKNVVIARKWEYRQAENDANYIPFSNNKKIISIKKRYARVKIPTICWRCTKSIINIMQCDRVFLLQIFASRCDVKWFYLHRALRICIAAITFYSIYYNCCCCTFAVVLLFSLAFFRTCFMYLFCKFRFHLDVSFTKQPHKDQKQTRKEKPLSVDCGDLKYHHKWKYSTNGS